MSADPDGSDSLSLKALRIVPDFIQFNENSDSLSLKVFRGSLAQIPQSRSVAFTDHASAAHRQLLRRLFSYQNKIQGIILEEMDASGVSDGMYTGAYDAGFIYAKVNVEVKEEKIISVTLVEHNHEKGIRAEEIPEKIVDSQTTKVDTISGATNSSKVIIKAVEEALK